MAVVLDETASLTKNSHEPPFLNKEKHQVKSAMNGEQDAKQALIQSQNGQPVTAMRPQKGMAYTNTNSSAKSNHNDRNSSSCGNNINNNNNNNIEDDLNHNDSTSGCQVDSSHVSRLAAPVARDKEQEANGMMKDDHNDMVRGKAERISQGNEQENEEKAKEENQIPQDQKGSTNGEISLVKKLTIDCLMGFIKLLIGVYDLISQPIFNYKHEVYKRVREIEEVQRCQQVNPTDPSSPWRQLYIPEWMRQVEAHVNSFETYADLIEDAMKKHDDLSCYGYREVLHEQWKKRPDSDKLLRQVELSPYRWITYRQFNAQIEAAKRGFLMEGIRTGDRVILYADTRPEWQICAQALIRLGATMATMYSTLGIEGIVHSVNETQVSHIIAQKERVNKLLRLKSKLPRLKKIIYLDTVLKLPNSELGGTYRDDENSAETSADDSSLFAGKQLDKSTDQEEWPKEFEHPEVECISFGELLSKACDSSRALEVSNLVEENNRTFKSSINRNSIALIMYTSGSTGIPKGVEINHENLLATVSSFTYVVKDIKHNPRATLACAYLPLAHIFEFSIESILLYNGVSYGFGTPHTLTDKSPGLVPGQKGDLTLLRPSLLIIVPLVLDRIVQGVKQTLKGESYFKQQLVTYLIDYKIRWQKKHYETPLVDKIVCSKIAAALGGNTKHVICGSAPLSAATQNFIRAALNIKLPQGFGTTETCASVSCQLFDDQTTENVGIPNAGVYIKLEPWIEGNYRPTDKPNPRGEIVVGGGTIAQGYYNMEKETRESFYVDDKGVRWYRTGDIGEFMPNGNLKIIDRKKDLVKLQNGEFISLGKVESTLKSNPYTDNFCVYANSKFNYIVALGPANEQALRNLARQIIDDTMRQKSSPRLSSRNEDFKKTESPPTSSSPLLEVDQEQQAALTELQEVLASYEEDNLNRSEMEELENRRKMSSLSTASANNTYVSCIDERLNRLCENQLIKGYVLNFINEMARERNLLTLEQPKKLLLLAEEWTEDKNLVTAAMKIRRNYIYKRYAEELENLYEH